MQDEDWFEDQRVGARGVTPSRTVTEADIALFAGLSGDHSGLHTSETVAAASEFGGRIAHGMLLLAIAHGLTAQAGRMARTGMALLGWREVRMLTPVRIGDTVHTEWETVETRGSASRPEAGIVRDRITLKNQRGEIVLEGEVAELVARGPA